MLFIGKDNVPVMASVQDIMLLLQKTLHREGIALLKDIQMPRSVNQDIMFTCPFHKNGNENRPSAGIMSKSSQGSDKIYWWCFNCHEKGTLETLVSRCFGYYGENFGTQWILKHFGTIEVENRTGLIYVPSRTKQVKKEIPKYISEEELDSYRYYCTYHRQRYLTDEIIDRYDIGYQKDFMGQEAITFPVKDEFGNCLFVARRMIHKKFYHYDSGITKGLYGVYEAKKYYPNAREVYICESMLNTLTLARWVPSISLLGTGTPLQYEMIKKLPYRSVILCLDNDEAGMRGEEKLIEALKCCKFINFMHPKDKSKDINDLGYIQSWEEFKTNCDMQPFMRRRNMWKN